MDLAGIWVLRNHTMALEETTEIERKRRKRDIPFSKLSDKRFGVVVQAIRVFPYTYPHTERRRKGREKKGKHTFTVDIKVGRKCLRLHSADISRHWCCHSVLVVVVRSCAEGEHETSQRDRKRGLSLRCRCVWTLSLDERARTQTGQDEADACGLSLDASVWTLARTRACGLSL